MTNTIGINIDISAFNIAGRWLKNYAEKQLPKKVQELLDRMVKEGEETAKIYLEHIDTGETLNSIVGYRNGNKGVIVAGGNAVWIEFGTGVYAPGQTTHPKLGEVPGIVGHGEYGEGQGADPSGWYYRNKFGEIRHTYGIASNPFMYETAKMLKEQCPQMAKEIFAK